MEASEDRKEMVYYMLYATYEEEEANRTNVFKLLAEIAVKKQDPDYLTQYKEATCTLNDPTLTN